MQTRRLIAVAAIIVVIIVIALLVNGCQSSAGKTSLENYNVAVSQLITDSDTNGAQVFSDLQSGELTTSGVPKLYNDLTNAAQTARTQLRHTQNLSVPGAMASAQSNLVTVMQLRSEGISQIAANIQKAADERTSRDAVNAMLVGTSQLYSSDVIYKTMVATDIAEAFNGAGVPVGTNAGDQQINPGQIVPDLGWLQFTFVATKTGAPLSTSQANANNIGSGPHGHELNYVSVNGTELTPGGAINTVPATSAPTFVLDLTNSGDYPEYQVKCKVSIKGLPDDTGTATIAETTKGEETTCAVKLPNSPPAGEYTVTAQVEKVPRETNTTNNILTYSVEFN